MPLTEGEGLRLEAWWADGRGRAPGPSPSDCFPEVYTMHRVANPEALNERADPDMWLADLLHGGDVAAASVRGIAIAGTPPPGSLSEAYDLVRLQHCSIVLAVRSSGSDPVGGSNSERLAMLYDLHGVERVQAPQAQAFAETLPLGKPRTGGSDSDVAARVVAASGVTARSFAGDRSGIWIGTSTPEFDPVWVDPSHHGNWAEPVMAVIGDPGAGKSVLMKLMGFIYLSDHRSVLVAATLRL